MLRSTLALFLGAMMSLFTGIFTVEGQVGIGTDSPNTSAILDIESSNRGFLPPRMTEAQMNAINLPAEGLVVYCTDCCTGQGRLVFYNGTIWKTIPGCGNNTTNLLPAADFDGDGIANVDDIDDDNDGILDIHEFGNNSQSFNTAVGAVDPDNNPTTVTLNATSPQEIHLDFTLLDQSLELTVNGQNISASHTVLELQNNWTSSLVFDDGNVMSQPFNASTATGNPPRVKIKITSAGEVIIHGTKTVSDAVYHKMKIQDGSSFNTINFIPGQNEVKFRNPNGQGGDKVIGEMRVYYSEDADNDGIPNNYDPDADNDGCSDAREAGLTNDNTAGFVFPNNNVGTNGYADNLETSADNGVPNYGSINMGTAVLNNSVNICNNQAPTATNPNITGTAQVGQTLTANFTYADNENNPAGTHTYQWYRADNNTGLNRAAIAGATNSTYALVAADNGKFIQFEVTPVASAGTITGTMVASAYTAQISTPNQAPTATNPNITGTAQVGQTLTANFTYADNENNPAGTHTYQWYRADNNTGLNRAAIAGATNSTYALVAADNGKFIQFEVTPVASAGTTPGMTTASNYSSAIASAIPATASLTFTITDNNIPNGKFHHFDNGFVNLFDGVTTYSSANSNDNKLHPTEYDNTSSFAQSNIKNNKNSPLMFRFANNQNTGTTLKVVWYNYDQGNNKTGFKRSRLIMELFNGNTLVQSAFSTVHADESESIARDFSVTATGTFNRVVIRTADDTKKHVMISEIEINNGNTTVAAGSISTD